MGKISSSVIEDRDLGHRASQNTSKFCKDKIGEARTRKPSQPGRPSSNEEALTQC